jgi:fructose-specific phosphotransferase system IIC component
MLTLLLGYLLLPLLIAQITVLIVLYVIVPILAKIEKKLR